MLIKQNKKKFSGIVKSNICTLYPLKKNRYLEMFLTVDLKKLFDTMLNTYVHILIYVNVNTKRIKQG